MTHYQGDLTG